MSWYDCFPSVPRHLFFQPVFLSLGENPFFLSSPLGSQGVPCPFNDPLADQTPHCFARPVLFLYSPNPFPINTLISIVELISNSWQQFTIRYKWLMVYCLNKPGGVCILKKDSYRPKGCRVWMSGHISGVRGVFGILGCQCPSFSAKRWLSSPGM